MRKIHSKGSVYHAILLVGVIVIATAAGYFLLNRSTEGTETPLESIKSSLISSPTPKPFAFQELTIPYLRNREYISRFGDLEKVSENGDFTSYLTVFDSDGFKVFGLLTIPDGVEPTGGWPAIVFVHGYIPPQEYQTLVDYASYSNSLARSGFVVFKIDLRGHGESQGEQGGAYYSPDYVIDALNAHSALASSGFVNPEKIGLWGHSMAGNVVFRSLVVNPEIPVAVIWAGAGYTYTDLRQYQIEDNTYQAPPPDSNVAKKRAAIRETYGEFDAQDPFWKQVTPINYLDGVKGAIQINHAVNDNVVSIEYARNLMNILDSTPITHELREYQSGGHNIDGVSFSLAMQNTVNFFDRYLR